MYPPTLAVHVTPNVITLNWEEITTFDHTGGYAPFMYWVEYFNEVGIWVVVNSFAGGKVTTFAHNHGTNFVSNVNVLYKMRAENEVAPSPYST